MAGTVASNGITTRIHVLLKERSEHESAIGKIEATLSAIEAALGVSTKAKSSPTTGKKRGPKPGSNRRRKRGLFAQSGDESILAFVRSAGMPTTKDVNKHWKAEGRGGSADNALTKLVKIKKIKRTAIKGERGSKYSAV